jgi:hypothetical protein
MSVKQCESLKTAPCIELLGREDISMAHNLASLPGPFETKSYKWTSQRRWPNTLNNRILLTKEGDVATGTRRPEYEAPPSNQLAPLSRDCLA